MVEAPDRCVITMKGVFWTFSASCVWLSSSILYLNFKEKNVDSSQETTSPDEQGKAPVSGGTSRFSRFGFGSQLLQKTMGLVLRPRPGQQVLLVVLYSVFSFQQ